MSGEGLVAPEDVVAVVPATVAVVWLLVVRYAVAAEEEKKVEDAVKEGERGEAGE